MHSSPVASENPSATNERQNVSWASRHVSTLFAWHTDTTSFEQAATAQSRQKASRDRGALCLAQAANSNNPQVKARVYMGHIVSKVGPVVLRGTRRPLVR